MNRENVEKPQSASLLSRRKGCLIALLVPSLLLGSLYVYLAFVPTGYEERVKANRAARDKILESGLQPPVPMVSPGETDRQTTATQPPVISPEEALFWGDAAERYKTWLRVLNNPESSYGLKGIFETLSSTLSSLSMAYPAYNHKSAVQGLLGRLQENNGRRMRSPEIQESQSSPDEETAAQYWTRLIQLMDGFEKVRSPEDVHKGDFNEILETLALCRAIRNGESEKIAHLVERNVMRCGSVLFPDQGRNCRWESGEKNILAMLAPSLFRAAASPKTPEYLLDWVDKMLAFWTLTPEEYAVLRADHVNKCREDWITELKNSLAEGDPHKMNGWHLFLSGIPEKVASKVAKPLLWRAIDRKTEALINLDATGYKEANRLLKFAAVGMNFPGIMDRPDDRLGTGDYSGLLAQDALGCDIEGHPIETSGGIRAFLDMNDDTSHTLFDQLVREEETCVERFNRAIAMTRFAFASARYRREQGRYPDSVTDLIPRYLDDSFAPTPDRLWYIFKSDPFTAVIPPDTFDSVSSATQVLIRYGEDPRNDGKLPAGVEDLKPYLDPGMDSSQFDGYFVRIEECPVYGLVVRNDPDPFPDVQGMEKEVIPSGWYSLTLYYSMPLWDPDQPLASPPRESDGAHPSPESKGGEEKP